MEFVLFFSIVTITMIIVGIVTSNGICGSMVYPVDRNLNTLLIHKLSKGIKKITSGSYYIDIQFNDNSTAHMWNSGRYYAWLSRGNIGDFYWDGARPTRSVMLKLKKAIDKYYTNLPL